MKAQSKLSPPNQSSLKKPILPVIQRSKPEDNNISSVNGGPDECKDLSLSINGYIYLKSSFASSRTKISGRREECIITE
jgi:hypothetical protein